jgi:hypothetical protein
MDLPIKSLMDKTLMQDLHDDMRVWCVADELFRGWLMADAIDTPILSLQDALRVHMFRMTN